MMNRNTKALFSAAMLMSVSAFAKDPRPTTDESRRDVALAREGLSKVRDELPAILKSVLDQPLAPVEDKDPAEKLTPPAPEDPSIAKV